MNWREGAILGTLVKTRGLMQLVNLNIGYAGLFAMMVLVALVTTLMTTPLVPWLVRSAVTQDAVWEREPDRVAIHPTPVLSK